MKSKEVLKLLKITRPTLCKWVKTGKLRAIKINRTTLDYNEDDVYRLAGLCQERKCVLYARVSTQKQKKDLNNQIDRINSFAISNGYVVKDIYKDVASGLNFDRGDFNKLVHEVIEHKIKTVIIENKDRLSRVSFNMWKELFASFNCNIIVASEINNTEADDKEIFSDIISLIHCFAMKMYSKRRKNKLNMIQENLQIENAIIE